MTSDQLVLALKADPFEPFLIRTADGSSHRIPDPMYVGYMDNARTAAVFVDGVVHMIDMKLIVELRFDHSLSF